MRIRKEIHGKELSFHLEAEDDKEKAQLLRVQSEEDRFWRELLTLLMSF